MAKLITVAENVCGSESRFELLGMEPKEGEDDAVAGGVIILLQNEEDQWQDWHRLIRVAHDSVPPGQAVMDEQEVEHDIRHCRWRFPKELSGRFILRRLSWGEHNLLPRPGVLW